MVQHAADKLAETTGHTNCRVTSINNCRKLTQCSNILASIKMMTEQP